jgi:Arginine methyltransferase oligomerization subdomain/Ribosomal protein L11 methyltransferase (PrmA)
MRIEYHRTLIADRVRIAAFHEALASAVKPGASVVSDIGAGTGIMGLLAAKLGAREVYLYEAAEVAGVAETILKANRARICQVIPCHSTELDDPPLADVVVSETLGNYALEENIITTLADARERHLKTGGTIIPGRITQYVVPVVSDRVHKELTVWDDVGFDLDLNVARTMSLNNVYVRSFAAEELLDGGAVAKTWDEVDLGTDARTNRKGEVKWRLDADTEIFGFAYWWEAELVPGVVLSTAPEAPKTHWEQLYFPLLNPIEARKGESVTISLRSQSSEEAGTHLAWTAVHFDESGRSAGRQALDLDEGWLP